MINVNIIMSVYNGEEYLAAQIDSILNSTVDNWRLFIFDDCSTDSSFEIANNYAKEHKHKIYAFKNHENMGSTKSFLYNLSRVSEKNIHNDKLKIVNSYVKRVPKKLTKRIVDTAISLKKTAVTFYRKPHLPSGKNRRYEYYMFADQDDFWLMDKIALTTKKMRKTEHRYGRHKPALVFTDAVLVDENLKFTDKSFFKTNHMKPKKKNLAHILMENKCIGCTTMVNQAAADLLRKTFPMDENPVTEGENINPAAEYDYVRYHDWWMAIICAAFGHIRYLDVPTIMYRQHQNNQVGQTSFMEYVRRRVDEMQNISKRLESTRRQALAFYRCYGSEMRKGKRRVLKNFIRLGSYGPIRKRVCILRYGFFKSGFIRNAGLMLYI
ncbi:MAG: glycosyltransferase [Lachnospiraceae bacterium]|nr:glycosyltransferase [Lachnospiraceae bacterium]